MGSCIKWFIARACLVSGRFITPRERSRMIRLLNRRLQVYRPDAAASDHGARGSKPACIVAGRFVTPRRRPWVMSRVVQRLRVYQLAGALPLRGGVGSHPASIVARVYHSWQVHHSVESVSDHRARGSPIARMKLGAFSTPRWQFRVIGLEDRSSRVR